MYGHTTLTFLLRIPYVRNVSMYSHSRSNLQYILDVLFDSRIILLNDQLSDEAREGQNIALK